jgi:hypothetical protein
VSVLADRRSGGWRVRTGPGGTRPRKVDVLFPRKIAATRAPTRGGSLVALLSSSRAPLRDTDVVEVRTTATVDATKRGLAFEPVLPVDASSLA